MLSLCLNLRHCASFLFVFDSYKYKSSMKSTFLTLLAVIKLRNRKIFTFKWRWFKIAIGKIDMLKKFECENFKGFKNPVVLDLTASKYNFNENIVKNGLVNKALIYGINGSGKSNFGIGLFDIVLHLTDKQRMDPRYLNNYICLETTQKTARFKYTFMFGQSEVIYEYEKTTPDSLAYEKLYVDGKRLIEYHYPSPFVRRRENNFIDPSIKGDLNINLIDGRLSVIKFIYRNTVRQENSPIVKLVEFAEGMLWYRGLSEGNAYAGFTNGVNSLDEVIYQSGKKDEFQAFLKENGIDFKLNFVLANNLHVLVVEYPGRRFVPFNSVASTGTNSLELFFHWKTFFPNIKFLFIDEFDAFLHYESAKKLIMSLNEADNFQSILTTHNTYLMNNRDSRPDCCYILSKGTIKNLVHMTDKEIREAHNLEKMYLNGAFNA